MSKTRQSIPRAIRGQVLNEFNHRCAICNADRPQIHHIDENPANNDPMNLIPLCPNHHLTDQHNPTQPISRGELSLFRQYKDPTILKPQFHPLYIRLQFLNHVDKHTDTNELSKKAQELIAFVKVLQMGEFYSAKVQELLGRPGGIGHSFSSDPESEQRHKEALSKAADEYRSKLGENRDEIFTLAVELLRYQSW